MHRSSRPRRWDDPPNAPECRRHRVSTSPAPAQGHLRKRPNASRAEFDSACNIGFSAEENSFALEIRQSSSKKSSGIPVKELIDEDVSKDKEIRCSSTNLIARLMGLDALPYPVRQQKIMHSYRQTTLSKGFLGNYVHYEDCSQRRSIKEDHECKDVFEVMETSKNKKHMNHSDSRRMLRCRGNEVDLDLIRQKFMDIKRLSTDEALQDSKELNDAIEVPDSRKHLFLELLQDPNSLFLKHLQDLNREPPSPQRSKITILKPCKDAKRWSNEVRRRSSRTERDHDRCSHIQQQVSDTGSSKMRAVSFNKQFIEENRGSVLHNSLASQHAGRPEAHFHPTRIVILKPSLEKAQKTAEADLLAHENFWFGSKNCRETAACRTQELHDEGRNKQKLPHHTEVLSHKVTGSREISRETTRKMKHTISSHTKKTFTSEMNPGSRDSFIMPGISELIHKESIYQIPDSFGEWSNRCSPSSLYSTKSPMSRDDRNRMSERRKITYQFQDLGLISQGSSTFDEMLVLSDIETPKFTVHRLNTKNASVENLASNEVLGIKSCHLGISSKDARRDGSSKFLPTSKSLPASCSPQLGDRKQDAACITTLINDVLDMGPSVSSDTKFSVLGIPLGKSSDYQNHESRLAHSAGEETVLPEREIHVNSEELRKQVHVRDFFDKTTVQPASTDYANTKRNQLTDNALIPVLKDVSWTTKEEQVMQSAFQVPSENGGLFGYIQNDIAIEEKSSDHPQVNLLPSESVMPIYYPLSSKDLEQPSPVSVLETPTEDETSSSGFFERLSVDLKELRMQLQRLKLQSMAAYAEETEVLMLSDEDSAGDNHGVLPSGKVVHQGFRDDNDRDFTYLLDIIMESGIHGVDSNKLLDACYLLGYPVDEKVFDKLENKYSGIASWPRQERKLLFDLINCTLADLVAPYLDVHPRVTSWKISTPACDHEGLVEGLWQMVVKQRKEVHCSQEDNILEPGWFVLECDVDLIGIEMERILSAELLEELVGEFVLP